MALLSDLIAVAPRFARSANLERDATSLEPLNGYVVTARALDVAERITATAASGEAGGAWSLTGPYGSGKSSLGLLLDAAFGPDGQARTAAQGLLSEASPSVGRLISDAHIRHDTTETGFHRGLVTSDREPLSLTVLRALKSAVSRPDSRSAGGGAPPNGLAAAAALNAALADAANSDPRPFGPSPSVIVDIATSLAEQRPLLLVLDEFGKSLEAAGNGFDSDPYLLQRLAEAGQGSGLPIFLLTLQHLSFEEHLSGTNGPQRQEWAKVQGRFEDVAYVESAAQTRALIGTAFDVQDQSLQGRIDSWADQQAAELRSLGVTELADPRPIASCYPLHPLTALVLPELCSRYGQHERTLFSFLTGNDPASAASFLRATELRNGEPLPSLELDAVYDYFVAGSSAIVAAPGRSSRWTEIATRLRDTHGLPDDQERLAKAVAVLNLVSTNGTVRASRPLLALAGDHVPAALDELETAGVVTYRRFADEYRAWQGSDIDLGLLLETTGAAIAEQPLVDVLSQVDELSPQAAARHSAQYGTLRVFARRYVDGMAVVDPPDVSSPYDGEVVLVVGNDGSPPRLKRDGGGIAQGIAAGFKPIVAAIPSDVGHLDAAARELATLTTALDDPAVATDWVARRELGERVAQAQSALEQAQRAAFEAPSCRWVLLDGEAGDDLPTGRGSAPLSAAADLAYCKPPPLRNEMLNRTDLTSQGAKARRELLTAMIEHGSQRDLGLSGFGPEVAMYKAFLESTGLHAEDPEHGYGFGEPTKEPLLHPAWNVMEAQFARSKQRRVNLADVFAALMSPPIGMKRGGVPVLVTVGLLARSDDIALYEHGTFKPVLSADLSERMVRNPAHFDIRAFANTTGARKQVIEAIGRNFGVQPPNGKLRVANVVAAVGHLVRRANRLDNYTRRTANLPPATRRVRDALLSATEPDDLLFSALPSALGLREVTSDEKSWPEAEAYAASLRAAVSELEGCLGDLLSELQDSLLESNGQTSRQAITSLAQLLDGQVLDSEVRAFVGALGNEGAESDASWISSIATVVARKAPAEWTDRDREGFKRALPPRLAAFDRLVALYSTHRADGGGPFDALRVTVTRPDGMEHVRLVGVDQRERAEVEDALEGALDRLADVTGSRHRARHTLLALLSDQLLNESRAAGGTVAHFESDNEGHVSQDTARYG